MDLIGRRNEQKLLRELWNSDDPHFVVVYGRRRVGKTYLVRKTFGDDITFTFTGIANSNIGENLKAFKSALLRHGYESATELTDWFSAFDELRNFIEQSKSDKKIIFIDEMPWMDTHKSRFVQAFEHFWNGWASNRQDILLIVCGSATAWISNKIFKAKGGLYNRVTRQILLKPFTLAECRQYFDAKSIRVNDHDLIESYMIFGGIPYYLSMLEKKYSLSQNVDRLCFEDGAPLQNEYISLFHSIFSKPERYIDVIEAISKKNIGLTRDEIVKSVSFPDGGNLTRVLTELELSGFIRKYKPFSRKKKMSLYQLSDFFANFYLTYMTENKANNENFWSEFSGSGRYRAWSGYSFEQVCLAHIPQIKQALGISGILTTISSWKSSSSEPGAQIDLILERSDNIINLCEMKYVVGEFVINKAYDKVLRNKQMAFENETKTKKRIHITLITTYGLRQNEYSGLVQSELTMEDLIS
jgi:AAA+ ATPase superfamily predicted ATPase